MENYKSGEDFLTKIYPELYHSELVQHTKTNKDTRISAVKKYMERLENVHKKAFSRNKETDRNTLKQFYYDKYIIKPEDIGEKYLESLDKQYFELYRYHINDEGKREHIKTIIEDQKKSLDLWIEYLSSEDANVYPMWAKYWAFQGMLSIGAYDNEKGIYKKRSKNTVSPFIELNQEVLAKSIDYMIKFIDEKNINDENLEQILNSGNFFKLYTILFSKIKNTLFDNMSIEGKWVKYDQGDNYLPLYKSLQGYGTGWCTAGEDTCKTQIKNGDFYVYYTKDKEGNEVIPRLAIRMNGHYKIGEIRGVAENQNIESHLEGVLEEKIRNFPDANKYKKRISDSKKLTNIYYKNEKNIELTREELEFLYETQEKIQGFGWQGDPRIAEIKTGRNAKKDLGLIFNVLEDEVALTQEEYLSNCNKYKVLIGNLNLDNLTSAEGLLLPETINGNLNLGSLTSAEGLVLPETINGRLKLGSLTSAEGLVLPETINGDLNLYSLTRAEGLVLPEAINGAIILANLTSAEGLVLPETLKESLVLDSLTSAEGLVLPKTIGRSLDLSNLTSAEGLVLPETIGGNLYLDSLTSAEGLVLPETINGLLTLRNLTRAEGLVLPKTMNGNLNLGSLTSAEGLVLPKTMNGNLYLSFLTSTEGLILPETIDGSLYLGSLTSVEGLVLPKTINGDLHLGGLTRAEGLVLPKIIGGNLDLRNLTSTEGLILPETIGGSLNLSSLTSAEGLALPETINGNLFLDSLTSAEGLALPEAINGGLTLRNLTSAEGLGLPEAINGLLDLRNLTSAKGLVLPETINGNLNLGSLKSAEGLILPEGLDLQYVHCSDEVKEYLSMHNSKSRR